MTEFDELVFTRVIPRVRAWELLNDPGYGQHLTTLELYDLMIRAGYSRETANEAAKQRGWDRLAAEVMM